MNALLNRHKSFAVKSKSLVKSGCQCKQWNTAYIYKFGGRLSASSVESLYPGASPRFSSSFIRASYIVSGSNVNFTDSNLVRCSFRTSDNSSLSLVNKSGGSCIFLRHFYVGPKRFDKEPLKPSSKVEKTVQAIKDSKEDEKPLATEEKSKPVKKSLKQKIIDECLHYYHGFRLLFIDINVSRKLVWRVLKGKTLTRREHRLLVQTVSDMFRLVPFSVFVVVPFMELLLPVAIKLFPGMLPSTFQTSSERENKLKQSLKVNLEMAKFLQQTLDDMAVKGKGHGSESAKEFADFFVKVRSSGTEATNKDIMKFSKLFEDEITLDSLTRAQLTALCRVLDLHTIGTKNFLRFQLRMKLRSLAADDKMIQKEGVDSLNITELQNACRARGMRAIGVPEARLKSQLVQWLDLSLNEKVPPSLLLLSRAMLLPDTIPPTEQLKATLSVLPDTVVTQAQAAIFEREGKIDNKTKIQIIEEEFRKVKEERKELSEEKIQEEQKEILVDTAPVITDKAINICDPASAPVAQVVQNMSSTDFEALENALESIGQEKKKLLVEKEELDDLKEELSEYQEDVDDLKQVTKEAHVNVKETKAAKRLFRKVTSMIGKMDAVLMELESEELRLKKDLANNGKLETTETEKKSEKLISIEDLITSIKQLQTVPDDSLVQRVTEVLDKIDVDHDGAIRVEDVLKVIELVGKEHVNLDQNQVNEIIELLSKEEIIEVEAQIKRMLEKEAVQKRLNEEEKKQQKAQASASETFDSTSNTPSDSSGVNLSDHIEGPKKL